MDKSQFILDSISHIKDILGFYFELIYCESFKIFERNQDINSNPEKENKNKDNVKPRCYKNSKPSIIRKENSEDFGNKENCKYLLCNFISKSE